MATKKKQPTLPLEDEQTKATESEILLATILEELRGLRDDFKSYAEKAGKHLTGGYLI
jgi:hypothetical protein